MATDMIEKEKLIEVFESWQGEGLFIGEKSLFIRFKRCNLDCSFCDTKMKMKFTGYHENYTKRQFLSSVMNTKTKNVVITGGEPSIYSTDVEKILDWGREVASLKYTIETNGRILPDCFFKYPNVSISISPKLFSENDVTFYKNLFTNNFKRLLDSATVFKFVVSESANYMLHTQELIDFVIDMFSEEDAPSRVYLMPEGRTMFEILSNTPKVFELAYLYNCNVTNRLHIMGAVL
jgi:organic radical activating enzyme